MIRNDWKHAVHVPVDTSKVRVRIKRHKFHLIKVLWIKKLILARRGIRKGITLLLNKCWTSFDKMVDGYPYDLERSSKISHLLIRIEWGFTDWSKLRYYQCGKNMRQRWKHKQLINKKMDDTHPLKLVAPWITNNLAEWSLRKQFPVQTLREGAAAVPQLACGPWNLDVQSRRVLAFSEFTFVFKRPFSNNVVFPNPKHDQL